MLLNNGYMLNGTKTGLLFCGICIRIPCGSVCAWAMRVAYVSVSNSLCIVGFVGGVCEDVWWTREWTIQETASFLVFSQTTA